MPDEHRLISANRVQRADRVAQQMPDVIVATSLRRVRLAVAAHVRCDRAISGRRERRQLVTPRVPRLRPAVHQQDDRAVLRPVFGDADANPVCLDVA